MRIAIFGVGGAGGYFAAQLVKAGKDVVFIARGEHLQAICENGLCVSTPQGEMLVQPRIATDDPEQAGIVDSVILGVKAEHVCNVAQTLGPMLGTDSFVVPLQNGVEAAPSLSSVLGQKHVVAGLCGTVSFVTAPGHIRSLGDVNFIRFGELDNRASARTAALRRAFDDAGVNAEIPDNIHKALWEKFLMVVSVGGVAALAGQPIGVIREQQQSRRLLELCMREILTLAVARGIPLEDSIVASTMRLVDSLPAEGTASLQRDLAAGKPSELEAWNGAVVRLAGASGVSVPVNEHIYRSLLPQEHNARNATKA